MSPIPDLETPRLVLRPFRMEDAAEVQILAGDPDVAGNTQNIPHPYEDGMAEAWISTHAATWEEGGGLTLAVTTRGGPALIGSMSLMEISAGHQAELGYWIGKPYWNRGFCTEAAAEVVRYAFSDMGLVRVHARHIISNPASGRVMLKIGMKPEGVLRKHFRRKDRIEDLAVYGILKGEMPGFLRRER